MIMGLQCMPTHSLQTIFYGALGSALRFAPDCPPTKRLKGGSEYLAHFFILSVTLNGEHRKRSVAGIFECLFLIDQMTGCIKVIHTMANMKDYVNKQILGVYDPACLLSLLGVFAAVVAMILALQGTIELALVGLMLAGLADLFDGVVARRLQRSDFEKEFGVQLDTTVDGVAFIATPAVIGLSSITVSWLAVIGVVGFVMAGVVRLAHFNTLSIRGADQSTHYRGLPVTYTALIFPLLFLLRDSVTAENFSLLLGFSFVVIALLFVINVPVRKPRGAFYIILPILAVGLIYYWVGHYLQSSGIT